MFQRLTLAAIDAYLRSCLQSQSGPQVKELSQQLGISRGVLNRSFRGMTGRYLRKYLRERTVELAKEQLTSSHLSLDQIALCCGFGTRRSFFRAFRRVTGMTPAEYRAQERRPSEEKPADQDPINAF